MLLALSLVATAAVSAQQWAPQQQQQRSVMSNISDMPSFDTAGAVENSHTISLNKNGVIEGQIPSSNSNGMNVYFIRNGKVAYQTRTSPYGAFQLSGVSTGPYSFVAAGPEGFSAYGVQVQEFNGQNQINTLEPASVSSQVAGFHKILADNLPIEVANYIVQSASKSTPSAQSMNQVRLVNNQLTGQVISLFGEGKTVRGTMVNLVQNGQRIADVQVDEQGNYTIPDLATGVYDFIAVGVNGLAAIRFEAVGQNSPMTKASYGRTPKLIPTSFDVCLTCQQDSYAVDQSVDYAPGQQSYPIEYAGESIGTGCANGGTCGSYDNYGGGGCSSCNNGGFYGGSGRSSGYGGRLLLFGGIATGITALAKDPAPQSPNN